MAAAGDPRGHGKQPAAHLQTAINHKSYLSIPLLSFRLWPGHAVVCERLLVLHSAGGLGAIGQSIGQGVWEPSGTNCSLGVAASVPWIAPSAREMFGGVSSSSASPFIAHLLALWASPSQCDGPAYSFTIRISLGHARDKPRDEPRISLCYHSTRRWGLTKLLPAVPVPASAFTLCSHRSVSSDTRRGNLMFAETGVQDRLQNPTQQIAPSPALHIAKRDSHPNTTVRWQSSLPDPGAPLQRYKGAGLAGMEERRGVTGFRCYWYATPSSFFFFFPSEMYIMVYTGRVWMSSGSSCVSR